MVMLSFAATPTFAGPLLDLPDLQRFADAVYSPDASQYLVVTTGGGLACAVRVSSDGEVVSANQFLSADDGNPYNMSAVSYSPVGRTYLAVGRKDDSQNMLVRYLDLEGVPVSDPATLTGRGGNPDIAWNSTLDRYLLAWSFGFQHTNYRMATGVPAGAPFLTQNVRVADDEWLGTASYGSGTDRFLFVSGQEGDGSQSNVFGRFISGAGADVGSRFGIAMTGQDETIPKVAYASSEDRWLVVWQRHVGGNRSFDVQGAFVESDGNVSAPFFIATTAGWEVPGDVVYDAVRDRFYVAWFVSPGIRLAEVNPATGVVSPLLGGGFVHTSQTHPLGDGFDALAIGANAHVLVVWHEGHGLSGTFATLVDTVSGAQVQVQSTLTTCPEVSQRPPETMSSGPLSDDPSPTSFAVPMTPDFGPALEVEKFVRNVTLGQTARHDEVQEVRQFHILQFITVIRSRSDRIVQGLSVRDILPAGMMFQDGSTLVDGQFVQDADIVGGGLAIGALGPGEVRQVRWSAQVLDITALTETINVLELPVAVGTGTEGTFFSVSFLDVSPEFIAARSQGELSQVLAVQHGVTDDATLPSPTSGTIAAQAAVPSTGAAGTMSIALTGAVVTTLAYAGYTRSGWFHRRHVERIAQSRDPMDFTW
jgi:hypothetical protein